MVRSVGRSPHRSSAFWPRHITSAAVQLAAWLYFRPERPQRSGDRVTPPRRAVASIRFVMAFTFAEWGRYQRWSRLSSRPARVATWYPEMGGPGIRGRMRSGSS